MSTGISHGVSVRFKVEDGDGAIVVVDPSAVEIIEYALPGVEEDVEVPRPAVEPPKDDVSIVTPDDAADSSILKMSGAPAGKRRRVFDDRLNVVPLGPCPQNGLWDPLRTKSGSDARRTK